MTSRVHAPQGAPSALAWGTGRLAGKTALVTGAGSAGIGRAIALEFARQGAELVVHDRTLAQCTDTVNLLRATGARVSALEADLESMASARLLVRQARLTLGRLDVVVANAGITQRKPLLELTDEDMQRVVGLNLLATMALTQEAARCMVAAGSGSIVIVSSVNQDLVIAEQAHYCASKGGLRQWGRALAASLGPSGVRANLLCPGAIDTAMNQGYLSQYPERRQAVIARTPLRRFGETSELGPAAVFLASDDARFITGTSLVVDGGLSVG